MLKRKATATWQGTGSRGSGSLTAVGALLQDIPFSQPSRFGDEDGTTGTSPEELLAAAHAACYAMSLGYALELAGITAERLLVEATVSLQAIDGGVELSGIHLDLNAKVPQITADDFEETAHAASALCPLSMALHSVPITIDITLEG